MAEEGFDVVTLQDNYYRDSFGRVVFILCSLVVCIASLVAISAYIFLTQPPPVTFKVGKEWRIVAPVQIQEPYLSDADLTQWVSNVLPSLFDVDFMHIDDQLNQLKQYFSQNGFDIFMNQFSNSVDKNLIIKYKLFVHATLTGAPIILSQNVLLGRYAWWVQIPIVISYSGMRAVNELHMILKLLVVRTEITDNLMGVEIDNVIVVQGNTTKVITNG